jgi:hypothetical protein
MEKGDVLDDIIKQNVGFTGESYAMFRNSQLSKALKSGAIGLYLEKKK